MTIAEVHDAIGRARPAWAELPSGSLVILVRAARKGDAVLVAPTTGRHFSPFWSAAPALTRRQDCDISPDPEWLAKARVSPRPHRALFDILNPDDSVRDVPAGGRTFEFDTDSAGRPR